MSLTKEQWQKIGGIVITALLGIAAVLGWFFPVGPGGEIGALVREKISIDARDDVLLYNGADQYVYSDDHSSQVLHIDGATGNVDAEGTGNFAGALTLQSGLTLENGETIVNSVDGTITVTVASDGAMAIETGNLQVGDGTPGLSLDGDDAYVAGTLEVDGATQFDGAADFNSTMAIGGDVTLENSETIVNSVDNTISMTCGTAAGIIAVSTGNLQVGDGTPGLSLDGDDAYIAGTMEVDGAMDLGSTLALAGTLTQSDGDLVVADDVRVISQTLQTVTNGDAFTVTGTYQEITAAGEVTPTITVGTVGDLLVLINVGSQTINVADSGIQMLSAAWAAGQYDVLVLWCDGTNWIEISRSDN